MPARLTRRNKLLMGAGGVVAVMAVSGYALAPTERLLAEGGSFLRDGEAGFVVTRFAYAVGPDSDATACPAGMSKDVSLIFGASPEGQRRAGEGDEEYSNRLKSGGNAISTAPDGRNYCMHPELAPPDPHTRALVYPLARAEGINLDGKVSRSQADARTGRLDFVGTDGTKGVDNQFWRAVGCNRSFQSAGHSNSFEIGMYAGEWGILIKLGDVDDLRNDDSVEVGIYPNADPIQISPTREALEYATYAMDQEEPFRATTTGRIENGILTSDPVDIRLRSVVNALYVQRPMRDVRIRATVSPQGVIKGYLAGYTPVEAMYDHQFGYRNAKVADGSLAPLRRRLGTSNGAARSLGHTCQGIWQSLHRLADGHLDPKSGAYTSISTQYRFEARPAFVVDVDTRSKNDVLIRND